MRFVCTILLGMLFLSKASATDCALCNEQMLTGTPSFPVNGVALKWNRGELATNRVDVLLAYDTAAAAWMASNGVSDVQSYLEGLLADMNAIIAQTGLSDFFTFRLAGTFLVQTDLSGLSFSFLPQYLCGYTKKKSVETFLQPLRAYRDAVAADVVAVLTGSSGGGTYGCAMPFSSEYLTSSGMEKYSEYAYCICDVGSISSRYTLMHEVGHLMGAGHANSQKSNPGPLLCKYSSGYYFSVGGLDYTTIMGYGYGASESQKARIRLPFFSSPDYMFLVEDPATGESVASGVTVGTVSRNDNSRTLRETCRLVSNFRVAELDPAFGHESADESSSAIALSIKDADRFDALLSEGDTVSGWRNVRRALTIAASTPAGKKVTISVKGLPSGLKYDKKTGSISGFSKKMGSFPVVVTAKSSGLKTVRQTLLLQMADLPTEIPGAYYGVVDASQSPYVATMSASSTGSVKFKTRYQGKVQTFSAAGYDSVVVEDGVVVAVRVAVSRKIKGETHTMTLLVGGRTATVANDVMQQYPWGRQDIRVPKFAKTLTQSYETPYGVLSVRMSGAGKVRVSGKLSAATVSCSTQFVSAEPYATSEWNASIPVVLPPKKNFPGLSLTIEAKLHTGGSGKIDRVDLCQ